MSAAKKKPKAGTALVLRVCDVNMRSYNDFQWPGIDQVAEAPDWEKTNDCGNGLHGWLHGAGDHGAATINTDSKWLVVEVVRKDIVMLGGKCKYPRGTVRFVGTRKGATDYLIANEPNAKNVGVIGAELIVDDNGFGQVGALGFLQGGYSSTLTGGDGSTLTGGDGSTLTGGYSSTLTGGYSSTLTGGYSSTLTGGDGSTLTGGYSSTLTGGYSSTLTGGYSSTLTGGYSSTLTGGDGSTLTGGNRSTLTGGDGSTLTGGDGSTLIFKFWDPKCDRYRTVTAYPGEDSVKVGVKYKLDGNNKLVEA